MTNEITQPNGVSMDSIRDQWNWDRSRVEAVQLERLNQLLAGLANHHFYRSRLDAIALPLSSLEQLSAIPLLEKSEMIPGTPGEPGRPFAEPKAAYTRYHQTSGTSGHPMPVLDTPADWDWWLHCWQHVLCAADVSESDVAMMAFSFGPFIGFWTACDALVKRGALVIPGGGMSSETRLQMIVDHRCTVVCCTPTYALHLLNVADRCGIDLTASAVSRLIVAGEPGGSVPAIRRRIEAGWGARVIDHSGASEVGAWGFGSDDGQGLHVIETEFIAELLCFDDEHPTTGRPAQEGETAELILTNLGRHGGPALRYRTGDVVRGWREHEHACRFLYLDGGVIGRSDNMMVIRGVNVFPSSIESIVRDFDPTVEFRMIAEKRGEMDSLTIEAELDEAGCRQLGELFQTRLALRVETRPVAVNSLPRFEGKSKRLDDRR